MALAWLKQILGDHYSEEIEKQIEAKIGEGFVARADFNGRSEELKLVKEQLTQRDSDIAALKKGAGESEDLKKQITEMQAKHKADADAAGERDPGNGRHGAPGEVGTQKQPEGGAYPLAGCASQCKNCTTADHLLSSLSCANM